MLMQFLLVMSSLEEAITYYYEAFTLCPPGSQACLLYINNLAHAVLFCYKQLGKMKDLEEAIM